VDCLRPIEAALANRERSSAQATCQAACNPGHSVHLAQLDWSPMERSSGPQTKLSSDHIALQCARQISRADPQFIMKHACPFLKVCAAARLSSPRITWRSSFLSEEFRPPLLPFVIGQAVDLATRTSLNLGGDANSGS
jgi:hypothetical protein